MPPEVYPILMAKNRKRLPKMEVFSYNHLSITYLQTGGDSGRPRASGAEGRER